MSKLKTNKGTRKRFKVTAKGKIKRAKANKRHILTKKSRKRKRGLNKKAIVSPAMEKQFKNLLPYG